MRNYSSYHFALQARLLQRLTLCHTRYLRGRRMFSLSPPSAADLIMAYTKFTSLEALDPPLTPLKFPPLPIWMSSTTIKLIGGRVALRRKSYH